MPGQLLSLHILGSQDQGIIEEFEFYSGEERILKCQIYDLQDNQKWQIPSSSTLTLTLSASPSDISIANANINIDTDDRSIFYVTLTEVQTASLISGSIILKIETASGANTITRYAVKERGLKKVTY